MPKFLIRFLNLGEDLFQVKATGISDSDMMIRTANGRLIAAEALGHREFIMNQNLRERIIELFFSHFLIVSLLIESGKTLWLMNNIPGQYESVAWAI